MPLVLFCNNKYFSLQGEHALRQYHTIINLLQETAMKNISI